MIWSQKGPRLYCQMPSLLHVIVASVYAMQTFNVFWSRIQTAIIESCVLFLRSLFVSKDAIFVNFIFMHAMQVTTRSVMCRAYRSTLLLHLIAAIIFRKRDTAADAVSCKTVPGFSSYPTPLCCVRRRLKRVEALQCSFAII